MDLLQSGRAFYDIGSEIQTHLGHSSWKQKSGGSKYKNLNYLALSFTVLCPSVPDLCGT